MSYQLFSLMIFLAVLLAAGIALMADAGLRMLRGQRR
jgi:hypothetical protein